MNNQEIVEMSEEILKTWDAQTESDKARAYEANFPKETIELLKFGVKYNLISDRFSVGSDGLHIDGKVQLKPFPDE